MKFFTSASAFALVASLASSVSAVVIPGADTPLFYFVSTSADSSANLLPLRINGGTSGYSTLSGSGPIGKFFFYQGKLVAADPAADPAVNPPNTAFLYRPNIGSVLGSTGCSTYGPLGFVQGSSSNKCARYETFQYQANPENSQLGSRLVFNWVGGFYSCGSGKDVYYKVAPGDGPTGCSAIDLYSVPVVA